MIFVWLITGFRWLLRLLIPSPQQVAWALSPLQAETIDPNQKCPSCGHTDGRIATIAGVDFGKDVTVTLVVQHTCNVCGAKWRQLPLVQKPEHVLDAPMQLQPGQEKLLQQVAKTA